MFTSTMNSAELYEEHLKDAPELNKSIDKVVDSDYVDRVCKKNFQKKKFAFSRPYTTARKNKYINVFIFTKDHGHRSNSSWNWETHHVAITTMNGARVAIVFYHELKLAIVYKGHFFSRYKERFGSVCDWKTRLKIDSADTMEKLIVIYLQRNMTIALHNTGVQYGNRLHIFTPSIDGAAMIQWDKARKVLQANTFITSDMYSKLQEKVSDEVAGHLQEKVDETPDILNYIEKWVRDAQELNNQSQTSKLEQ